MDREKVYVVDENDQVISEKWRDETEPKDRIRIVSIWVENDNDVHLFEAVGHKVAMGNGTEKLQSLADEVIDSVDEDGLARFITRHLETDQ